MNQCPITYESCGNEKYSKAGLRKLNRNLILLNPFPYNIQEQVREAAARADKISIQGVQPKLSVRLNIKKQGFEIVDENSLFILKPQNMTYPQLPENEDLTMRLARIIGIDVPLHGQIYCKDGSLSYFIRRFDRPSRNKKYHQEDFSQVAGLDRDNKYNYSLEKVVDLLDYCSYPMIEGSKLFLLILFSFLTGNEDMHLKNFSIITVDSKIELSPAYDLLNSTITFQQMGRALNDVEESALPLGGKTKKFTRKLLIDYFAKDRLRLSDRIIEKHLKVFRKSLSSWITLIDKSFLTADAKELYKTLVIERFKRLNLN